MTVSYTHLSALPNAESFSSSSEEDSDQADADYGRLDEDENIDPDFSQPEEDEKDSAFGRADETEKDVYKRQLFMWILFLKHMP